MTTLVVDGYNAIYAVPEARKKLGKSLESARNNILALSKEYARKSGYIDEVRVVFDGDDRYRYLDSLDLGRLRSQVFSSTGKGDEKIIAMVKACSRGGKVVLASNDNYIRNNARAYGAALMDVKELGVKKRKLAGSGRDGRGGLDSSDYDKITREYREELGI